MHPTSVRMKALTALCVVVTATAAFGISLTEYTFPTSRSQIAYVSGNFNANGTSHDTNSTQTAYNLNGTASYNYDFRSLPFTYKFTTNDSVALFRPLVRDTVTNGKQQGYYSFDFLTRANKYIANDSKIFGFGELHTNFLKPYSNDNAYKTEIDATTGGGYGRTVNATALKQAIRMSEDFKRFLVSKGDIPDDVLLQLARIIDNESEYRTMYGEIEYRKYWYNDMEEALRDAGVLIGDRLGAMGILRIQEVLVEPTGLRLYGWEARAGVRMVLQDYYGKRGDPLLSAELDWSRPMNIALQFNDELTANTIFNKIFEKDSSTYDVGNNFQVYYEISNRVHWDNQFNLTAKFHKTNVKNTYVGNVSSGFQFYIENELLFNTGINFTHTDNGITKPVTNWVLSSGINYRIR